MLVFAELLRSFGGRSETKPVWRIPFFTNRNLAIVVAITLGLQVWSQHSTVLGRFFKTTYVPLADCCLLLALGAIPLIVLEIVKLVRNKIGGKMADNGPHLVSTRSSQLQRGLSCR